MLEQEHPLHFQALPADLAPTDYVGRVAFMENPEHPAFAGLAQADFFTWSGDHVVYRNVYKKATRGAVSLAHCDEQLGYSAIAECPVNEGLMVLCQMVVGEKLATDPVAQRLFDNLLCLLRALRAGAEEHGRGDGSQEPRRETAGRFGPEVRRRRRRALGHGRRQAPDRRLRRHAGQPQGAWPPPPTASRRSPPRAAGSWPGG